MKSFTPMKWGFYLPSFVKALLSGLLLIALATAAQAQATLDPSQPVNTKICTGNNVSFYVYATATSGTITYQWQESQDGGITWTNLVEGTTVGANATTGIYTGTTTSVLTIVKAPSSMEGYKYRANVFVNGANMVSSAQGTLNVGPDVSLDAQTFTNCPTTTSTLAAPPSSQSYQWQVSADGGSSWSNVPDGAGPSGVTYGGETTADLSIGSLSTGIDGYEYRYIANDGTCSATSGPITQRVPTIALFTVPSSVTANVGDPANITANITVGTSPYTYQWQVASGLGAYQNILATNTAYSGATSATLTILSVATATYSNRYRVLIHNAGNCASLATAFTTIGSPVVLALGISDLTAEKQGASAVKLSWTVSSAAAATSYTVQKAVNGSAFVDAGSVPASTGISDYTYTDASAGGGSLQYRVKGVSLDGTAVYSAVASVASTGADRLADRLELRPSVVTGSGTLNLYSVLSNSSALALTITDMTGRVLSATTVQPGAGSNYTAVDVTRLAKGMYYVRVANSDGLVRTMPFVKD